MGTLLHQDPRARIIQSHGASTVGQHDPFSWEVKGTGFVPLPHRSRRGERESAGFRGWVDSMNPQEREEFTEVFFSLLAASQAETLSELSQGWADSALAVVSAYAALPPEIRRDMPRVYLALAKKPQLGNFGRGKRGLSFVREGSVRGCRIFCLV